ncbi:hypothetical protein EV702DRAFT_1092096 [Suillus placidus]|uniref:Signal peptidase complex catalytic subunit SEC11 n=1 Tax=Suillus placidus TaxID=48579 RepID=A0A9P6ZXX2_9AGAM|nr:hypothetical protein EV702DRAFT_1092096 [Suillus placidus]
MFSDELKGFRRLGFRHVRFSILESTDFLMLWKGLGLILNTESPIVVVLSGSMEPAFYRGDLLFLTNPPGQRYHTGDITVYRIPGAEIPIVHRDNNHVDDIDLYQGLEWLDRRHIIGKVRGFLPYIGYVTIATVSLFHRPG